MRSFRHRPMSDRSCFALAFVLAGISGGIVGAMIGGLLTWITYARF